MRFWKLAPVFHGPGTAGRFAGVWAAVDGEAVKSHPVGRVIHGRVYSELCQIIGLSRELLGVWVFVLGANQRIGGALSFWKRLSLSTGLVWPTPNC